MNSETKIPSQAEVKASEGVTTRDSNLSFERFTYVMSSHGPRNPRAAKWLYKADIEHLRYLYEVKKFSCYEIADIFDCGGTTVKGYLPEVGIPLRPLGEGQREGGRRFFGSPKHLESIKESSVQTIVNFNKSQKGSEHRSTHVRQLNKAKLSEAQRMLVGCLRELGWSIRDDHVNYEFKVSKWPCIVEPEIALYLWNQNKTRDLMYWYFLDIADPDILLCIEVDGWTHENPEKIKYDKIREKDLIKFGWVIVRFTDEEIMSNVEVVARQILDVRRNLQERKAQPVVG